MNLKLFTEQIPENAYVRDNFKKLSDSLNKEDILRGNFKFFEIVITDATGVTSFDYPHNLGYQPRDIILLSVSNSADITWHYDSFTATNVRLTTTDDCTIRCFIGTYK